MIVERAKNWQGPWEPVVDSKIPSYVWRRYNRNVKRGRRDDLIVPVNKYYYRIVFCV